MAKALFGYATGPDPRAVTRLEEQNRALRQRVEDLEALVARLQLENDLLAPAVTDDALTPA